MPAHAFVTVATGPFTFPAATNESLTTQNLSFTAPVVPPNANILSRVRLIFNGTNFAGTAALFNNTASTKNTTVNATLDLTFSGPIPPVVVTTPLVSAGVYSLAPGINNPSLAGNPFNPAQIVINTSTAALRTYFTSGATLLTTQAAFSVSPSAGVLDNFDNASITGSFNVEYDFVPGPLPVAGAAAAFLQSRRLRKRIKARA